MAFRYSLTGDERIIGLLHDCLVEALLRDGFTRSLEIDGMMAPHVQQFSRDTLAVVIETHRDAEGPQMRLTVESDAVDARIYMKRAGIGLLEMCVTRAVAPALGVPPKELMGKLEPLLREIAS